MPLPISVLYSKRSLATVGGARLTMCEAGMNSIGQSSLLVNVSLLCQLIDEYVCSRDCPKKGRFWKKLREMHKQYGNLVTDLKTKCNLICLRTHYQSLYFALIMHMNLLKEADSGVFAARSIHGRWALPSSTDRTSEDLTS